MSVMRIATPVIAAMAVWGAGEALKAGYRASTGNAPPEAEDLDAPFVRVLTFSAAAAVLAAIVNTGITRGIAIATAPSNEEEALA